MNIIMEKTNVIIMAGGLGKRMQSDIPKVLHKINDKPMLVTIIETVLQLNLNRIFIVVGKYKNIIKETIDNYINSDIIQFVLQEYPLGTGNAIQCCYNNLLLNHNFKTLILSGDVPLIKAETLKKMIKLNKDCLILTSDIDNPHGYGRIIRKENKFVKIQEEKDCDDREKKICEINSGIYLIQTGYIISTILNLSNNNNQKEYYLTDIFKLIKDKNIDIDLLKLNSEDNYQIKGVNTIDQLNELKIL